MDAHERSADGRRVEERLHRGVVHWLFDRGWGELRPIQLAALEAFQDCEDDLILTARTAGGKTEAAFLPVISSIAGDASGGVRALYVGPLRALINDQFRRLEELCGHLDVPVHRWHGEVGAAARRRLLDDPGGILLITPESIESLFLNRPQHVARLFARLDCCVIDELHVFPGVERGQHLRSLLSRLEAVRGRRVRRIGLSATLARPDEAAAWLRSEAPDTVRVLSSNERGSELRTKVHAYRFPAEPESDAPAQSGDPVPTPSRLVSDLLEHHATGTSLVFANSRRVVEESASEARALFAARRWDSDRIRVHHGSVGRLLREETEQALQSGGDQVCFCTSTLELGIDLGDVQAVAHIGAPHSAASAAQRLGRSGRRADAPTVFRQYVRLAPAGDDVDESSLAFPLLRAVALVECYLDGWVEPTRMDRYHLSTLLHQILCTIAQHSGCTPPRLFELLCNRGNFHWISEATFARLLRSAGAHGLLSQMDDGTLLLGAEGERWVESREIYAVFQTPEDWRVDHGGTTIGSIPLTNVLMPDDKLLLAGRPWRVVGADAKERILSVVPGREGRPALYGGDPADVHPEVLRRMRGLLRADAPVPDFCDAPARSLIEEARRRFAQHVEGRTLSAGPSSTLLWTWAGTAVDRTLAAFFRMALPGVGTDYGSATVELECSPERVREGAGVLARMQDPRRELVRFLARGPDLLQTEKFDAYLPAEDLAIQHAHDRFDVDGALDVLERTVAAGLDD